MTCAYPECYLDSAKAHLAEAFDYAVRDCRLTGDMFSSLFSLSRVGECFAKGFPWAVCGLSGVELAQTAIAERMPELRELPDPSPIYGRSIPFWAGWSVAHYQWRSSASFASIFTLAPYGELEGMYPVYHEQDISAFVRDMEERRAQAAAGRPTNLRLARERAGLSQSQLAKEARVGLRSIQMYEQRNNDIDKAQGAALFRMAKVLGCGVDDLLEDPLGERVEYTYAKV